MKSNFNTLKELKQFIILWLTQSLSQLGSAMTNFALVIWLYQSSGSALTTALLTVCSYAPYVIMSIFAGAISDRWNKKAVMLICDSFAALCTVTVFILLKTDTLAVWHLYVLNALNGLMNTIQQPASDVATTLLTPEKHYQKTSGMRSFSNSLITILTPVFATAFTAFAGVEAVICFDLTTFFTAFIVLLFFIRLPKVKAEENKKESLLSSAKGGLVFLKSNKGILWLIIFLSAVNLIASIYDAAFPAMVLSVADETVLGVANAVIGAANLAGSLVVTFLPAPKNRAKTVCDCMLISLSTENFLLAFGRSPILWYIGGILGWITIPIMNANLDVIFRTRIPVEMQGRVYSARNTLQFFTIPVGYLLGGALVDNVFEPFMAGIPKDSILASLFGSQKGSGAAFLFFVIGLAGVAVCLIFRRIKAIRELK
ncbi:MAG: MFS transporter [Firmicutes bacterium]|nr:MFS transporter [[Eubacterium] siraeum]MCM1487620.1 MFS transporter [Bacillota bacterium]